MTKWMWRTQAVPITVPQDWWFISVYRLEEDAAFCLLKEGVGMHLSVGLSRRMHASVPDEGTESDKRKEEKER